MVRFSSGARQALISYQDHHMLSLFLSLALSLSLSLAGYCPQFDALLDKLTVREHLCLFARIKGVSEADLDAGVAKARTRTTTFDSMYIS